MRHNMHVDRGQRTIQSSQFSPSPTWVLRLKLSLCIGNTQGLTV